MKLSSLSEAERHKTYTTDYSYRHDGGKQVLETAKTLHANELAFQEGASEMLECIKGMDNTNN